MAGMGWKWTTETCQNQMHDPNDVSSPLTHADMYVLDTEKEETFMWCSPCLSRFIRERRIYELLCSCEHARSFHDFIFEEMGVRENYRFDVCAVVGVDCICLNEERVYCVKHCNCKSFRPTNLRLSRRSDSGSISGQ